MSATPRFDVPDNRVRAAAVEALSLGLSVLPTKLDGTKAPGVLWKPYQSQRATRAQVEAWFSNGQSGWGIVCGAISGGIEMLELEGRAVAEGMLDKFTRACADAGLGDVLQAIRDGYTERTPSGGLHLLFAVEGGPCRGNLKLAQRKVGNEVQTLIETRGEGGFVVLAPSHGPVHPTGKTWELIRGSLDTIVIISADERDALYGVARTFDGMSTVMDTPPPKETGPAGPVSQTSGTRLGSPALFIDPVCIELAKHPWHEYLVDRHKWKHHHDDGAVGYWTRPGKDPNDGWSATTNAKGTDRLINFSSSVPLEACNGIDEAPSFDRLDVIAAYGYGGERVEAARALADEFGIPRTSTTSASVDESALHLPDEFWNARPGLAHIKRAALAMLISPDAVCGAALARIVALSHHALTLPPLVGRVGSPDLFVAIVAGPSVGKGSTMDTAALLLPPPPTLGSWLPGRFVEAPVGSGEGIVKLFFETSALLDENGKKIGPVKPRQVAWNALIRIDEVETLEHLTKRQDQTTMSVLRSAWSREMLGPAYADELKNLRLQQGTYRLGIVMGVQPSAAGFLLDDHGTGTPQRFVFVSGTHPDVSDVDLPDWPGPLRWRPIRLADTDDGRLGVASSIVAELRARHVAVVTGKIVDPLHAHAGLRQLKTAAALAMLDSRPEINDEDWQLAAMFTTIGDAGRDRLRNALQHERQLREQATDERAGRRRASELQAEEHAVEQRIERGAQVLRNKLLKVGQPMTWHELRDALGRYKREAVAIREYAVDNGLIAERDDGTWVPCG